MHSLNQRGRLLCTTCSMPKPELVKSRLLPAVAPAPPPPSYLSSCSLAWLLAPRAIGGALVITLAPPTRVFLLRCGKRLTESFLSPPSIPEGAAAGGRRSALLRGDGAESSDPLVDLVNTAGGGTSRRLLHLCNVQVDGKFLLTRFAEKHVVRHTSPELRLIPDLRAGYSSSGRAESQIL